MLPLSDALRHPWLHRWARRYLNPWVLRLGLAGGRHSPIGLVLHVSRRTGHQYATPLAVHRRGARCFIPLAYGPAARWCLNVLAAGGCRVRIRGHEYVGTEPRVVGRGALPPPLRAVYRWIGIREFLTLTLDPGDMSGPRPRSGR